MRKPSVPKVASDEGDTFWNTWLDNKPSATEADSLPAAGTSQAGGQREVGQPDAKDDTGSQKSKSGLSPVIAEANVDDVASTSTAGGGTVEAVERVKGTALGDDRLADTASWRTVDLEQDSLLDAVRTDDGSSDGSSLPAFAVEADAAVDVGTRLDEVAGGDLGSVVCDAAWSMAGGGSFASVGSAGSVEGSGQWMDVGQNVLLSDSQSSESALVSSSDSQTVIVVGARREEEEEEEEEEGVVGASRATVWEGEGEVVDAGRERDSEDGAEEEGRDGSERMSTERKEDAQRLATDVRTDGADASQDVDETCGRQDPGIGTERDESLDEDAAAKDDDVDDELSESSRTLTADDFDAAADVAGGAGRGATAATAGGCQLDGSSYVKSLLEEAMTESAKADDTASSHSSEMVRVGSANNSGHTSTDEVDTTTSSDIEVISHRSTPNGSEAAGRTSATPATFDLSPLRHAFDSRRGRSDSSSSGSRHGDDVGSATADGLPGGVSGDEKTAAAGGRDFRT